MYPNGVVGPKPVCLGDATMSLVKMPKPRIGCGEAEVKCGAQRSVAVRIVAKARCDQIIAPSSLPSINSEKPRSPYLMKIFGFRGSCRIAVSNIGIASLARPVNVKHIPIWSYA